MGSKDVDKLIEDYHSYLVDLKETYKWDDTKIDKAFLPMVL